MKAAVVLAIALSQAACVAGHDAALSAAAAVDPTGITSLVGGAVTNEAPPPQPPLSIAQMGAKLSDVAAGHVMHPDLTASASAALGAAKARILAGSARSVASTLAGAAMSGGIGLIAAAPSLAMNAAMTGMAMSQLGAAEAQVAEAAAETAAARASARIVPDDDRPAEARALLSIVDKPAGATARWSNPDTGASGTVTLDKVLEEDGPVACRPGTRTYKQQGAGRKGGVVLCRQDGEWYELS